VGNSRPAWASYADPVRSFGEDQERLRLAMVAFWAEVRAARRRLLIFTVVVAAVVEVGLAVTGWRR